MDIDKEIERSIIKKYRKVIWHPFIQAITDYNMIQDNDKIAVCISGGKDSFLLAKCMQELQRHGKKKIELVFLVMNPGYNKKNIEKIKENSKKLNIPITIFDTDVFDVSSKLDKDKPCYMCARMRRGCLYSKAQELGCNKIALGHHYDDVLETILLNIFYAGEFKTMMPKLHSTNFNGMELIRPLYLVREKDIVVWKNSFNLEFLNCACKFTENVRNKEVDSKRYEMKELIAKLEAKNPLVAKSIFKSSEKINLDTILSYKKKDNIYSFLDTYEE